MLRLIASIVGVLLAASTISLEPGHPGSATQQSGSVAKVLIPKVEPLPQDVSVDGGPIYKC